ncbi:tyrosine-type recombinase/integrase [Chitinophaga niabensis]|uniref:Integrase n=1 Tax=Chitinophaga niabensis TaxID=536979 RepID=A0A1N6ERJ9_9BACT|nr:tyrosine-type recombinase/integrase [Chitinophaga niabensis]SIN85722.1 integrase [Chitinophaga niabensis]
MGYGKRTPKGEISIDNHLGRIRLRWRHNKQRHQLNLPYSYTPENIHYATVKAAEIKLDIMKGYFDPSLEKYKPPVTIKPAKVKTLEELPAVIAGPVHLLFLHELAAKFNVWGNNIRNIDVENSIDYLYTRKVLEKWVDVPIELIAEKLNAEDWAVTTYNRRLHYLKTFFIWLLTNGIITQNYLADVCRKKDKNKKKTARREPISEKEISSFLKAIRNDTYCPPASRFKHSYYYPFLLFIFHTGVRNAEAIGLRVRHIDLEKGQIEISEAFARTIKGANHAARIRKDTKMGNTRYLPMSDDLRLLLIPQMEMKAPDDFVFLSPYGLSIDDRMLQRRIFKPVMIKLGIGDKDLYVARHCFGTRAVQQGMPVTDVAYLMGHSTIETAMRNYVSVNKPAVSLPAINLSRN